MPYKQTNKSSVTGPRIKPTGQSMQGRGQASVRPKPKGRGEQAAVSPKPKRAMQRPDYTGTKGMERQRVRRAVEEKVQRGAVASKNRRAPNQPLPAGAYIRPGNGRYIQGPGRA